MKAATDQSSKAAHWAPGKNGSRRCTNGVESRDFWVVLFPHLTRTSSILHGWTSKQITNKTFNLNGPPTTKLVIYLQAKKRTSKKNTLKTYHNPTQPLKKTPNPADRLQPIQQVPPPLRCEAPTGCRGCRPAAREWFALPRRRTLQFLGGESGR